MPNQVRQTRLEPRVVHFTDYLGKELDIRRLEIARLDASVPGCHYYKGLKGSVRAFWIERHGTNVREDPINLPFLQPPC